MAQQKRYKAINFDLSSEQLREILGGERGRRKAYSQVKSFLTKEGFDHRQWSGYVSQTPKSNAEMYEIIDRLAQHCLWLDRCVNKFDVTNVGTESDMRDENLNHYFSFALLYNEYVNTLNQYEVNGYGTDSAN